MIRLALAAVFFAAGTVAGHADRLSLDDRVQHALAAADALLGASGIKP